MAALSLFSAPCGDHQFPFAFRIPCGASAGFISATSADTDSLLPPFCFSPFPPPNSIGKSRFGGHLAAEEKALPPKAHTYFSPQRRKMQSAEGAMGDIEDGHQPNKKKFILGQPKKQNSSRRTRIFRKGRRAQWKEASFPYSSIINSNSSIQQFFFFFFHFLVSPRFSFFGPWRCPHILPRHSAHPMVHYYSITTSTANSPTKNGCCPPLL